MAFNGGNYFLSPKVGPTSESSRKEDPCPETYVVELICTRQEAKEGDDNAKYGEPRRDRCSVAPVPVVSVIPAAVRTRLLGYGHGIRDDLPDHVRWERSPWDELAIDTEHVKVHRRQRVPWCIGWGTRQSDRDRRRPALPPAPLAVKVTSCPPTRAFPIIRHSPQLSTTRSLVRTISPHYP